MVNAWYMGYGWLWSSVSKWESLVSLQINSLYMGELPNFGPCLPHESQPNKAAVHVVF